MSRNVKDLSPEKIRMLCASESLSDSDADEYGDAFLEAGKLTQALLFYERSNNPEKFARVKSVALEQGDAFFLHSVERFVPGSVEQEEWLQAGKNAFDRKQFIFARDCFERAEDPVRAHEAHEAYLAIFPSAPTDDAPSGPE